MTRYRIYRQSPAIPHSMQACRQKNTILNAVNIIALFVLCKMLDHIIVAPLFVSENRWHDLPKYNDYEELYDMLPGQQN